MTDTVRTVSPASRDDVLLRLRRIEGQVRGIQRMVEEGKDCRKIVQQIAAVRAALSGVNAIVLECYARGCLDDTERTDETVAELIDVVFKASR